MCCSNRRTNRCGYKPATIVAGEKALSWYQARRARKQQERQQLEANPVVMQQTGQTNQSVSTPSEQEKIDRAVAAALAKYGIEPPRYEEVMGKTGKI